MNKLRLENWPLGLTAPGPSFNFNTLGLEDMKKLVSTDGSEGSDGDLPCIAKWGEGNGWLSLTCQYYLTSGFSSGPLLRY